MSSPRRRILRPVLEPTVDVRPQRQAQKLRHRLEAEKAALERWMRRLKRAFHSVERLQRTIGRLERHIAKLENVDANH